MFDKACAWFRGEMEVCYQVLRAGKINEPTEGRMFNAKDGCVWLSLIRKEDGFEMLMQRLNKLVYEEHNVKN